MLWRFCWKDSSFPPPAPARGRDSAAALPPLVGVIAFLFLYGESGLVTRIVQRILGMQEAPWRLKGVGAIVFVHAYTMYVYVFLFVSAGLERFDATLDEAASGLGASTWRRLRRVTLPLLMPAVAGSALLVFMNALGSFSAPYVFGGGLRVLSTQILASKLNGAMGLAYVETTVLALSAVAGLVLFRWLDRKRKYTLASKGGRSRRVIGSRRVQILTSVAAAVIVVALVLPHLMVVLVSFARDGSWTTQVLPPEYTFENYRRLFSESELCGRSRTASRWPYATAAICRCFLAAYLICSVDSRGAGCSSFSSALPWRISRDSNRARSRGYLHRNDLFSARILLVGTFWILPLAYFIRDIPLVASEVESSLRQMDSSLEDAARGLGASGSDDATSHSAGAGRA